MDNLLPKEMESFIFLKHSPWILCIISVRLLDWTFNINTLPGTLSRMTRIDLMIAPALMACTWLIFHLMTLSLCLYWALIIIKFGCFIVYDEM